jgi:hypothetical protein
VDRKQAVALAVGAVAFILAWTGSRAFFGRTADPRSAQFLNEVAAGLNKTLPMLVDKDTELMNTMGLDGVLVYNYRLVNHTAAQLDAQRLIAALTPQITKAACSTPDTRDGFLKQGVSLRYMYADRDRTHLATITVSPKDCGF